MLAEIGLPEMLVCAECQVNPPMPEPVAIVRRPVKQELREPKEEGALARAAALLKTAPVEDSRLPREPEYSGVVGSSQREYKACVDTAEANRKILAHLQAHYRQWVPMVRLIEVGGVIAVHSRMPEIRQMIAADEDVDNCNMYYAPTGKTHSHYRLCRKIESERLKRKRNDELKHRRE